MGGWGGGQDSGDKCTPVFMAAPVEIIIAFHHKYPRAKNRPTSAQLARSTCQRMISPIKHVKTCF